MGRLLLRSRSLGEIAGLAPSRPPLMEHWTLRLPSGCMILEVHEDPEAWRNDLDRSSAMFRDPIHRFTSESFAFRDERSGKLAVEAFARAGQALAKAPTPAAPMAASGPLLGRLVSFNRLPHLRSEVEEEVWGAIAAHTFASVLQLRISTPTGDTLVDAYLDEPALMDDFVFLQDVVAQAGHELRNEWYPFTDRQHERALDRLAFGLGRLPDPPS